MRRLHLFELEDQRWFPTLFRDLLTDALQFSMTRLGTYDGVLPLVERLLEASGGTRIVDLCSGASGPWTRLLPRLAERRPIEVVLTDKFPNRTALARAAATSGGRITFEAEPVDATAVPVHLTGVRTLWSAFHHFRPEVATQILADAGRARQPIGVFEFTERRLFNILVTLLLVPISMLIGTLFMRPLTPARLFFTYLVPAIPLAMTFDAVVSCLRTYKPAELERLARAAAPEYEWEAGISRGARGARVTYLIGLPPRADRLVDLLPGPESAGDQRAQRHR